MITPVPLLRRNYLLSGNGFLLEWSELIRRIPKGLLLNVALHKDLLKLFVVLLSRLANLIVILPEKIHLWGLMLLVYGESLS